MEESVAGNNTVVEGTEVVTKDFGIFVHTVLRDQLPPVLLAEGRDLL